jgi:hypothetical protein
MALYNFGLNNEQWSQFKKVIESEITAHLNNTTVICDRYALYGYVAVHHNDTMTSYIHNRWGDRLFITGDIEDMNCVPNIIYTLTEQLHIIRAH